MAPVGCCSRRHIFRVPPITGGTGTWASPSHRTARPRSTPPTRGQRCVAKLKLNTKSLSFVFLYGRPRNRPRAPLRADTDRTITHSGTPPQQILVLDLSLSAKSEGRVLGRLKGHMEPAHVVVGRPHCAQLISVGSDGLVLVWDYDPPPPSPRGRRRRTAAAAAATAGLGSRGDASAARAPGPPSTDHGQGDATGGGDRDCWTSDEESSGGEDQAPDWRRSGSRQKRRRREGFVPPILRGGT